MSESSSIPRPSAKFLRTPAAKIGMILALLILMEIPLQLVSSLISERQDRAGEVLAGFRRGWGPEQAVAGPMLVVPYSYPDPGRQPIEPGRRAHGWAQYPASRLDVVASLAPETRRRGLFHAVVYTASVELSGSFAIPPLVIKDQPDAVVDWSGARVALGASDLRGMSADPDMEWNGARISLESSEDDGCGFAFLGASAGLQAPPAPGASIPFKAALTLRGTQAFRIVPVGRQIDMRIASSWATPSFAGATLPLNYDMSAAGFNARWEMAGDPAASGWRLVRQPAPACEPSGGQQWQDADAQVGVELQEAVPTYLMVSRASKYGVLFLALSYLTLFLFETLSRARIHLVQYGMVGLSVSLFALLLISIAEPLGFAAAYAISTAAVMAQASLYTLSVVRRPRLAAVFGGVLGALFAFLYVVLSLDAYALLAGTVALFVVLSVVMVATRRVNWSDAEQF